MKKSVYSLVLMDSVIKAADEAAYKLGTSRSNLINQILAEHLACVTPEMRMKQIFAAISEAMTAHYQIQEQRSDSLMTLRTSLEYRYRPVLNYKIELARSPESYLGTLRAQIRTQNPSLISIFESFFSYWTNLELRLLPSPADKLYSYDLAPGCFSRALLNISDPDKDVSDAITSYISLLDKAIKLYISAPHAFASAAPEIEREYKSHLIHTII